jgi:hypothetical protein
MARNTFDKRGGVHDRTDSAGRRYYNYDRVVEPAREGDPSITLANADNYALFARAVWLWDVPPEPLLAPGQAPRPPVVPSDAIVMVLAAVRLIVSFAVGQWHSWKPGSHIEL